MGTVLYATISGLAATSSVIGAAAGDFVITTTMGIVAIGSSIATVLSAKNKRN